MKQTEIFHSDLTMKMMFAVITLAFAVAAVSAQFDNCTDYIDFGEDFNSHNYTSSGYAAIGAYTCDGRNDSTLRIGNCGSAQGNVSFTLLNGDKLSFVVAWQNSYSDVYIDGEYFGNISGGGGCNVESFDLPDSGDASVEVTIVDPTLGCPGDIQIASVCVTGTFDSMFFFLFLSFFLSFYVKPIKMK